MRLPGLALELQSVPHGGEGNSLGDWTSSAAPGKSGPGCNASPDPQTKDSSTGGALGATLEGEACEGSQTIQENTVSGRSGF